MTSQPSSLFSENIATIDSLCIGSGRFLRSVLVPALVQADYNPCIVQTRGRSFLDSIAESESKSSWTYEVDTVHYDGRIETSNVPFWGAGTLGSDEGKNDVLELMSLKELGSKSNGDEPTKPFIIGVGVTEAGLSSASTKAMKDLYDILKTLSKRKDTIEQTICVINMDNVPKNGSLLQKFMNELACDAMERFLAERVVFHNTMVDRITSQRPGSNGLVPRAEPTPLKALVIEDLQKALPEVFSSDTLRNCGVVVRNRHRVLDADIALKLRVANGTHTAAAHAMALACLVKTDILSSPSSSLATLLMKYLDSFFEHQILRGAMATTDFEATQSEIQAVYDDWRRRLIHAHFGLSTFFITQNGAAKGGIRIGPTIKDLILSSEKQDVPISCSTVFALAALLRFLTNSGKKNGSGPYNGWLDPKRCDTKESEESTVTYADGLTYDRKEGWYSFRCDCEVTVDGETEALPKALCKIGTGKQPLEYEAVIKAYLCKPNGGDLLSVSNTFAFGVLVKAVATLYARMVGGDAILDVLASLDLEASCECLVDGE